MGSMTMVTPSGRLFRDCMENALLKFEEVDTVETGVPIETSLLAPVDSFLSSVLFYPLPIRSQTLKGQNVHYG